MLITKYLGVTLDLLFVVTGVKYSNLIKQMVIISHLIDHTTSVKEHAYIVHQTN